MRPQISLVHRVIRALILGVAAILILVRFHH